MHRPTWFTVGSDSVGVWPLVYRRWDAFRCSLSNNGLLACRLSVRSSSLARVWFVYKTMFFVSWFAVVRAAPSVTRSYKTSRLTYASFVPLFDILYYIAGIILSVRNLHGLQRQITISRPIYRDIKKLHFFKKKGYILSFPSVQTTVCAQIRRTDWKGESCQNDVVAIASESEILSYKRWLHDSSG